MTASTEVTVCTAYTLNSAQIGAILALCDRAVDIDGVPALNEHTLLHLRHQPAEGDGSQQFDNEFSDVHLLAIQDDVLVGYAHVDPTDQVAGTSAEMLVLPDRRRRGVGRRLVTAALAASPDGRLRLWAHGATPAARHLATKLGFSEVRRLEQWRRDLRVPLPRAQFPDGVRVRAFVPGQDEAAWLGINHRAFAAHPEQGRWTEQDLAARMAEPWFDPRGLLLAEHHDDATGTAELVAFHWTKVHGHAQASVRVHDPIGEVYVVGVDPQWQGRGLGRPITVAGLQWLAHQGLDRALLYVDSDNHAAKSLYRKLGFTLWETDVMFMYRSPELPVHHPNDMATAQTKKRSA